MNVSRLLAEAPHELRIASQESEAKYELAEDLVAVHGGGSTPATVLTLQGGDIAVNRLGRTEPPAGTLGPVYRQAPGGGIAVPTGRVLVRFAEGDSAVAHEGDLRAAGYRLEEVLAYAPHVAWTRATSGEIVTGLRRLNRLAAAPGVEHAEPQLIAEAHARR